MNNFHIQQTIAAAQDGHAPAGESKHSGGERGFIAKPFSFHIPQTGNDQLDKSLFGNGKYPPLSQGGDEVNANGVSVELLNKEMWEEFHAVTNEMVVTKPGRKMFPKLELRVTGLEPKAIYFFVIGMQHVDNYRYKFQGGWSPSGQDDMSEGQSGLFHHDGPECSGEFWMKNPVCFDRVKLTNRTNVDGGQLISLQSMHKYQPLVVIFKKQMPARCVCVFAPKETQFIAVTAYQSERIISLKVKYNPFAKGFRKDADRKRSLSISPGSESSPNSSGSGVSMAKRGRRNLQLPCPLPDSTQSTAMSPFTGLRSYMDPFMMGGGGGGPGKAFAPFAPYYNALAYTSAFEQATLSRLRHSTEGSLGKKEEEDGAVEREVVPQCTTQQLQLNNDSKAYPPQDPGGETACFPPPNFGPVDATAGGIGWNQTAAENALMSYPAYWNYFYHQMFPTSQRKY